MDYNNYDRLPPNGYPQSFSDDIPSSGAEVIPKVLSIILLVLIVALAAGTAVSFATRGKDLFHAYRQADPSPQKVINLSKRTNERVAAYTDLGQLRIRTKGATAQEQGATVVVSPWFTYPEGDTALFEEIAQKERLTRSLFSDYFSVYTRDELLTKGELQVKTDLLAILNEHLVLGKIKGIYFNQYMFVE